MAPPIKPSLFPDPKFNILRCAGDLVGTCITLASKLFALGSIQLLPVIRRRVAERGLSGGVAIPLILAVIGFVVFMVGAFEATL